jgi:predicted secreted protein
LLVKRAQDPQPTLSKRWWLWVRRGGATPAAVAAEEAAAAEAQEEAPAEGGLVDIASILGAPAVTIVRSSL